MADNETLAYATLTVSALSAIFLGIRALKDISARLTLGDSGLIEPVVCPNCGQPFDARHSYRCTPFPIVNGVRTVSCPRCSYTFIA